MTTTQDPIAHAARLLREAAEELRQAHAFPGIEGCENETDAKAAYDEHMGAAPAEALGYFSFSDECGFDRHDTAEAAKAAATEMLSEIRRELGGEEWPMDVESICWGVVVERATEHDQTTGGDGEKYCDYVLKGAPPTPPAEKQAAPKAAPGDQRKAFESWARRQPWIKDCGKASDGDAYGHWDTQKAWLAWSAALAAPQQEAQEPVAISEAIERMADDRYKVVPSHESMFHRWAVVATGTQQLYLGREAECQNMARKFAGAFLDGAFVAMQQAAPQPAPAPLSRNQIREVFMAHGFTIKEGQTELKQYVYDAAHALLELVAAPQQEAQEPVMIYHGRCTIDCGEHGHHDVEMLRMIPAGSKLYTAPQPAPAPLSDDVVRDAAFESVRKKLCALPRYSFVLDDDGLVRRVQVRTGNWIEFDDAHELFDPVAVDTALAAQGGK